VTAMRLRVLLPHETLVDAAATRIAAHAVDGAFGLLPRHVDLVTALPPGIVAYLDEAGIERFVATDDAVLVKCGAEVRVSTARAVVAAELGELRPALQRLLASTAEREVLARSAVRKLEVTLLRGLLSLEEVGGG
jgi:F-type H+-transporting ATPase subunit epsilon